MKYQKKLKGLLSKDIFDIILFGSLVKAGRPRDIDIAVIVKDKIKTIEIKKNIRSLIKNSDIEVISIESMHSPLFFTLVKEGYSVKKNKYLYELYNLKPSVLYKFSLKKLNNVQKVQFERGLKNVIADKGTVLTRSVVLIPISIKDEFNDFLNNWNIYYDSQEYELVPLLRKDVFL